MAFESGSLSIRMFYLIGARSRPSWEAMARHAAPPLKTLGTGVIQGWVGGRHLLDVPLTEENTLHGGFLRVTLLRAERKVPPSLFRAECMMEELARLRAEKKAFLDRATRGEIRREVMDRLLPQMPPTLRGLPLVYDPADRIVFAAALSEKQADELRVHWLRAQGFEIAPLNVETAAAQRKGVRTREWARTSFSPEVADADVDENPAADFLTWLWFFSEARGGLIKAGDLGEAAVGVEGPLLFAREGEGAHETVLRKGAPTASVEARACLLAGKKLRRARLTMGRRDEAWTCTFDAESFACRSLRLPDPEEGLDPISRFQDRMRRLGTFREMLLQFLDRFVEERKDPRRWESVKQEIHTWADGRRGRR